MGICHRGRHLHPQMRHRKCRNSPRLPLRINSAISSSPKYGDRFLAGALARQVSDRGIPSVTQNPGNLNTGLLRHALWILTFATSPLLYSGKMDAYITLWVGLPENLCEMDEGGYVVPWGRVRQSPRQDLLYVVKINQEKGQFWGCRCIHGIL